VTRLFFEIKTTKDNSYSGDNRVIVIRSSHFGSRLPPRCWIEFSWR